MRIRPRFDPFRIILILLVGAAFIYLAFSIGRSPLGWLI